MNRGVWKGLPTTSRLFVIATAVAALACGRESRVQAPKAPSAPNAPNAPAAPTTAPAATGRAPKRMSDAGLAHIREREAFMPQPYDDGAGNLTIGYGHLIRKGENFSGGITKAQADSLFRKDVERVVNPAFDKIRVNLTQNQVDALGSFIFNVGTGGFVKNLLPHVNAGSEEAVTSRMLKYVTGRDVRSGRRRVLRGLLTRRRFEVALFKSPTNLRYLPGVLPQS